MQTTTTLLSEYGNAFRTPISLCFYADDLRCGNHRRMKNGQFSTVVATVQQISTRTYGENGNKMMILTLQDTSKELRAVGFNDVFQMLQDTLQLGHTFTFAGIRAVLSKHTSNIELQITSHTKIEPATTLGITQSNVMDISQVTKLQPSTNGNLTAIVNEQLDVSQTANGKDMRRLRLIDSTGEVDLLCFADATKQSNIQVGDVVHVSFKTSDRSRAILTFSELLKNDSDQTEELRSWYSAYTTKKRKRLDNMSIESLSECVPNEKVNVKGLVRWVRDVDNPDKPRRLIAISDRTTAIHVTIFGEHSALPLEANQIVYLKNAKMNYWNGLTIAAWDVQVLEESDPDLDAAKEIEFETLPNLSVLASPDS